jgi:cholesterol 7-dehydrogenase
MPVLKEFFGWNITVFQVGPGTVYLFVKSPLFTIVFIQYVQTIGKYTQYLHHDIYAPSWMPYWLSAALLYAEAIQVFNDTLIWDSKQFKRKFHYLS